MMNDRLREFIDSATEAKRISDEDVQALTGEILEGGLKSRLEVESLLALDRVVEAVESWGAALTKLVVEFVVWHRSPEGVVASDDAHWLATVLEISGASRNAMNIAYGILDVARHVDGVLLDFIMRGRQQARLSQIAA